jgi:hypothetical protein
MKMNHKVNAFLPCFDQKLDLLEIVMVGVEIARPLA